MISVKLRSLVWSGIEKFSTYGIQLLVTIFIARILTPEDYGLVAMLSIFFSFSQALIDSGFSSSLIQKQDCNQQDFSTVFYFNILVSILLYIILFFSSPLISRFYNNDLLTILTKVYALNLIINASTMVHRTILTKRLMFKDLAIISFISSLIGGIIGIIMAYYGFKYWALVFQMLITSTISGILYLVILKWIPSLTFSVNSFKKLAPFGFQMMLTALLFSIYNNLYSLVIGKRYSPRELGLFNRAFSFSNILPLGISDFSMRVFFPIQAKIQNNDDDLKKDFLRSLHMVMFIVIPINIFLLFNAKDLIFFLLSEKWEDMTQLFQVLCLSSILYPMVQLNWNILKAKGRSDLLFRSEVIKKILGITILIFTVNLGVMIMALGLLVYAFIDIYISISFVNRLIDLSFLTQFKQIYLAFVFAIISSVLACFLSIFISIIFLKILISGLLFLAFYWLLSFIKKDEAIIYLMSVFDK